jgi:hypothetical protein
VFLLNLRMLPRSANPRKRSSNMFSIKGSLTHA